MRTNRGTRGFSVAASLHDQRDGGGAEAGGAADEHDAAAGADAAGVVRRATDILNDRGRPLKGAKVLVLGVAYKRDVSDARESPAIEVIKLLRGKGAVVEYADPHVPVFTVNDEELRAVEPTPKRLAACDLAIIITDHRAFDYAAIIEHAPAIFDTRNATKNLDDPDNKVTKL